MPRLRFLILPVLLLLFVASSLDAREWTDKRGRTYDGLFSGMVNGVVEIDSNGRILRIPFDDLIEADQQYVREQMAAIGGNAGDPGGAGAGNPGAGNQGAGNQGVGNQGGNPNAGNSGPGTDTGSGGAGIEVPTLNERLWTDTNGQTVSGRFGGLVDENTITIVQPNNGRVDVPINNLSDADKAYVNEVIQRFDPRIHGRIWTMMTGETMQGTYVQIKNTQVRILTSFNDDQLNVEKVQLSGADLTHICGLLNAQVTTPPRIANAIFRVWTAADGSWRAIGRLKDFNNDEVLLEQEDSDIAIPIASLAADDQSLVRDMIPDAGYEDEPGYGDDEESKRKAEEFEETDLGWKRYYSMHPVFYVILAISVLGLIGVIAFKYISESFEPDDD